MRQAWKLQEHGLSVYQTIARILRTLNWRDFCRSPLYSLDINILN